MNLLQILLVLRARYKVAVLVALFTAAAGTIGGMYVPKSYTASTAVMVDIRSPDPVAAMFGGAMRAPGTMGTQLEIITSSRTAQKVVKLLRLDESPAVRAQWQAATGGKGKLEEWLGELLAKGVKVTPARDSSILTISYQGRDPTFVAAIANGFAQAYIETSIELKVEPARQYSRWFAEQAKVSRENVEKAQARLSDYQREKGIVATDENLDYETTKLNELSARLTAAQAEIRDAQSKQRSGSGAADTLPEVMQNAAVASLRANINQLEAKLKEAAGNFGNKHPQYLRMESELAEMKRNLELEMRRVTNSFSTTSAVGKTREAELVATIEAQKRKLLLLRSGRDEIAVLVRDVDTAKRAYEAVTTRFNQTSLESQATETNVSVLTPAVEPVKPSFPKPLETTIVLAIVAGVLLGGVAAFAFELLDRRVRSAKDLSEMLQLPVLGVIGRARQPRRLLFWRRSTILLAR